MAETDAPLDVYLAYYADADTAQLDYDDLKSLADDDTIKIEAIMLASRDADGKIHVKDNDHSGRKGAGWGAAIGLVAGALFPPSLLAGAAVGGLAGGGIGSLVSAANKSAIKADLEDEMPPDSSAVVAVFDEIWVDQVAKALARAGSVEKEQLHDDSKKAVKDANG